MVASAIDQRLALAYRLYRPFEQRLLATSRAVIATSPPYLEASTALASWRERCHIVPLGLNPNRITDPDPGGADASRTAVGNNGIPVLAIGRLTYYKGHDVLIRATASLENSRVLIVGTGEHRDRLTALIQSAKLSERVRLPGFQPETDLNALLASCDAVSTVAGAHRSFWAGAAGGDAVWQARRGERHPRLRRGLVTRQAGHGLLVPPATRRRWRRRYARSSTIPTSDEPWVGRRGGVTGTIRHRTGCRAVAALYRRVLAPVRCPLPSRESAGWAAKGEG